MLVDLVNQHFRLQKINNRYYKGIEHDSLIVDAKIGKFYWNSKGLYGTRRDFAIKVLGWSSEKFEDFESDYMENLNPFFDGQLDSYERLEDIPLISNTITAQHPYLESRGVLPETAIYFGLEASENKIGIPFLDYSGQQRIGTQFRHTNGYKPKYITVVKEGVDRPILWPLQTVTHSNEKVVLLFEGAFSVMKWWQCLELTHGPEIGLDNRFAYFAALGTIGVKSLERILGLFSKVTVIGDADDASLKSTKKACDKFMMRYIHPDVMPDEMTPDEIIAIASTLL